MKAQLAALWLGGGETQVATSAPLHQEPWNGEDELVEALSAAEDAHHPLGLRRAALPGRMALVPDGERTARLVFPPGEGFKDLAPFGFEEAAQALARPAEARAFLGELVASLLLETRPDLVPDRTALVAVVPLGTPIRFRGALWDVLEESGFRWVRVVYPPETTLLWTAVARGARHLVARAGAEGPPVPGEVEPARDGYRLTLGSEEEPAEGAQPFAWEPSPREALRGALLVGALLAVLRRPVRIRRGWRFALSIDGRTAELLRPQPVPGRTDEARVDFVPFGVAGAEHDPALALYAGLHDGLPLSGMAFCGAQRVNRFRLADNGGRLVGFAELVSGRGVRWGWQLPMTGETQAETLAQDLFRSG